MGEIHPVTVFRSPVFAARLRELFGIDLRSLGVFRIVLGAIVLADLLLRLPLLDVNYTASGVLPVPGGGGLPGLSIHRWSGTLGWQIALFGAAGVSAAMLIAGYRTRLATIASWVLLTSLHNRSPLLTDGGDTLLRWLLLWSMFLPLGARFSVDARRRGSGGAAPGGVLSAASVALLLQFAFFFCFAGLTKSGPQWRTDGTAIQIAVGQEYWARPLGAELSRFPGLLAAMTPNVVRLEILLPLLFFVPVFTGPLRVAGIAIGWMFVAGLGLSIQLNLFPFAAAAAMLPFLPAWFWERLERAGVRTPGGGAAEHAPAPRALRLAGQGVVVVLVLYVAALNLRSIGLLRVPRAILEPADRIGLFQTWAMYAPAPGNNDFRIQAVATLGDGSSVELIEDFDDARWERIGRVHRNYRLKYYLSKNLGETPPHEARRQMYLQWLCRQWQERIADTAAPSRVELWVLSRPIVPEKPEVFERRPLSALECASASAR